MTKPKPKPWEDHNFGVVAESVYCLVCNEEIDPRQDLNTCLECLVFVYPDDCITTDK
jgi:hypothetical protein